MHPHSLPVKPTASTSSSNTTTTQRLSPTTPRTTPSITQHSYNNQNNNNNKTDSPLSFLPSKPSTTSTTSTTTTSSSFNFNSSNSSLPLKPSSSSSSSSLPPKPSSSSSNYREMNSNSNSNQNPFALPSKPEFSTTTTTRLSSPAGPPSPRQVLKREEEKQVEEEEEEEVKEEEKDSRTGGRRGQTEEEVVVVDSKIDYKDKVVKEEEQEKEENKIVGEGGGGGGGGGGMSRSSSSTTTNSSSSSSSSRGASGSVADSNKSRSQTPLKREEEEEDSDEDPVVSNRKSSSSTTPVTITKSKTPRRKGGGGGGGRTPPSSLVEPQLIPHLPLAELEASKTYLEISESIYFNKSLGNTHYYDPDNARCDCSWKPLGTGTTGSSLGEQSCGEYSGCMNRMLQMECEKGDCRCGENCQNQRFQNREYAPIEIVQTEKKGFGVRTSIDLTADTFVYEYVGEVIGPAPFARKMKEYAQEGIKHFYFMALDKEVFIDATKKGGKGRFLNHSCNPNCQVAKWTVGKKMRMGIFTKRDVLKNEELTFNYNVDRYGHLAQECFCGEPNCVGFIGGKTQTDIGGMDDLYIDALGIKDEVETLGLKGSKKKKGRKLDEDYNPTLGPISSDEVPKVASAIRQALQTRRILTKLLERVEMTDDDEVQRQLLRLHGLSLMNNILREYPKDTQVLNLDLTILTKWKFQTRNKIETSKIEDQIKSFIDYKDKDDDNNKISTMAKQLLSNWSELSLGFRIPKAVGGGGESSSSSSSDLKRPSSHFDIDQLAKRARLQEEESLLSPSSSSSLPLDSNGHLENRKTKFVRPEANTTVSLMRHSRKILPHGWTVLFSEQGKEYYRNDFNGKTQWEIPIKPASMNDSTTNLMNGHGTPSKSSSSTMTGQLVLDAATLVAEAEKAAKEAKELEIKRLELEEMEKKREKEERQRRKKQEKEEREREKKEKKVLGLFSTVVVSTMSKYRSQFEPDAFKKRAKEVTQILLDKEKKRPTFDSDTYESLSIEKEAKVKSFVKDWVKKLLERKKSSTTTSGRNSGTSTPKTTSTSISSASKSRPSILNFDSTSSASTPRLSGLEIGDETSPATPLTGPMDLDTPTTSNGEGKCISTDPSGTPRGTPPSHRQQHS